ncbi:MAG: hypothetical protein M3R17_12285 [Bacteroidota bacterium]|nr:hypothetical protein [Bacteroidota bacterium]
MRLIYIFLLAVFISGCGDPSADKKATPDYFREDVLKLGRAGLMKNLPAGKLDSLVDIYRKDSVNGLRELLVASGDLLKINVGLNGRTLQEVYQKICDTIGMKYPELKCDEVQASLLSDDAAKKDTDWVVLKVRFGQTWYERKLYYMDKWQIDDFIYRIYNRKLADEGKPVRLHLVTYDCIGCADSLDDYMGTIDVKRYGFMMLTKAQEDSLLGVPALGMETENQFAIFTTQQMNEQLTKFEASGLVDVIGTKWYEKAKKDVMQSALYDQRELYEFFDTLFSSTILDTGNSYNPYEEILVSLAKVSRGKFNPTAITDDEETKYTRKVQFTFDKDVYQFEAQQRGGFLFPGIIDNVNKALSDHNAGGAFYTVSTKDNFCMLIYIDDDKVEKVKASGLFMEFEKGPSLELKERWSSAVAL